jgi:hypothetical protein
MSIDLGGHKISDFYVKTSTKPSYEITSKEHSYLNHKFKYPGVITHNDIDVKLVESIGGEQIKALLDYIKESGYAWMHGEDLDSGKYHTVGKRKAAKADIIMIEINADGKSMSSYTLKNAWVKKFSTTDLSYESEDLTELTMTFAYDWFVYNQIEKDE